MTRTDSIERINRYFHSGEFLAELGRRVAYPTESQNAGREEVLRGYLEEGLKPMLSELGFTTKLVESAKGKRPYLLAERIENAAAPGLTKSPTCRSSTRATMPSSGALTTV